MDPKTSHISEGRGHGYCKLASILNSCRHGHCLPRTWTAGCDAFDAKQQHCGRQSGTDPF
eukprot:9269789-Prorocentrum_lima.AAC.1